MTRRRLDLRLGIDVGGTNTDAVVLDREDRLLAKAKAPTTPDVSSRHRGGRGRGAGGGHIDRARISHAMLGTTHATNAVLERRRLHRVAVLRIGAPATLSRAAAADLAPRAARRRLRRRDHRAPAASSSMAARSCPSTRPRCGDFLAPAARQRRRGGHHQRLRSGLGAP